MTGVIMNGRILLLASNGQKRVAEEICNRLGLEVVKPRPNHASGNSGHLWEQAVLPLRLHGRPLWSPSTSAPVLYSNQVVTVHDIGFVDAPQFFTPQFARAYSLIVRAISRTARHLVAVSEFSRQRIIAEYGLGPDRVSCIYPGISEAFHIRREAEVAAVRARYGLGDVPYIVGFSGSDSRKNTNGLITAWNALGAERGEAKLVLFGKMSNPKVFGNAAEVLNGEGIVRVGGVSDDELAALFSGCNGLVFPSLYEGFGLPIVEAAASGAPVVCSRVASMPEIAPKSAILVDPGRMDDIASALAACLRSTPNAVQRRAIAAETVRFSWDGAARAYGKLFERVFR